MRLLDPVNAVRQNHALEHATMHVLSRRNPSIPLVGRSGLSGFTILGALSTSEVEKAVAEALARLQLGESQLAVHPRCGTNLAVTGLLAGTAAYAATLGARRTRLERLPLVLLAATLGVVVAQPLATRIQERVTTCPCLDGVSIAGIRRRELRQVVAHEVMVRRT